MKRNIKKLVHCRYGQQSLTFQAQAFRGLRYLPYRLRYHIGSTHFYILICVSEHCLHNWSCLKIENSVKLGVATKSTLYILCLQHIYGCFQRELSALSNSFSLVSTQSSVSGHSSNFSVNRRHLCQVSLNLAKCYINKHCSVIQHIYIYGIYI